MLEARIAKEADTTLLIPLLQEQEVADTGFQSDRSMWEKRLLNWFSQPLGAVLIVVEKQGKLLGMATLIPHFPAADIAPSWMVKGVFVGKPHRGKGIGKSLLIGCAAEAIRRGAQKLDITVDRENAEALRFYEKLGGSDAEKRYLRWRLNEASPLTQHPYIPKTIAFE
jgi:GNAT superfamily N-acetyltransferase